MANITGTSGDDALNGTSSEDTISGLAGNDTLSGLGGDDSLLGSNGSDSLVGGAGVDTLNGGGGNDIYVIDASDTLIDSGGVDTVRVNFSYTLLNGFEDLVLLGGAAIDGTGNGAENTITGNNAANQLSGGGGNDTLIGGAGADTLIGGAGTDILVGSGGNDSYTIDAFDFLVENGGIDAVRANFSYTLLESFENLVLTGGSAIDGTGNNTANTITGNNAANTLEGDAGNDTLDGGAGADVLLGGDGQDVLIHRAGDASVGGGAGTDTLEIAGSGITLDLTATPNTRHADIEVLDLAGAGNHTLILARADVLAISSATDTLRIDGGAGDAVITTGSWSLDQFMVVGGETFVEYTNGAAILRVDTDIDRSGITLSSINLGALDGANGFRLGGDEAGDFSGRSVAAAGDVNGDGFGDVIVGAYNAQNDDGQVQAGASYVLFGRASGFASSINLPTLDGTNGFRLEGVAEDDYSGISVAAAGDVNGDGFGDVIVGAYGTDPNGELSGASYVVFGKASGFDDIIALSEFDGTDGFRLEGVAAYDYSGYSVAGAGDVNGDGFDDLIVGAYYADANGSDSGASYVVFGKASGFAASINLSTLDGANGFRLEGVAVGDGSGFSVAGAGDVNGDSFDDVIVGAPSAPSASYVVFGKATGFAASINLSTLDGTTGFRLDGVTAGDQSGSAVAAAGDVNGDGFGDLIVGAFGAGPNGLVSGASYVVFGKASGFATSINLSTLNGTTGFRLEGVAEVDRSGRSVSAAGDVNGDGFDDLIVGATGADPNGSASGASYVVFGKASGFAASINLSTLNGTNGFRLEGGAAYDGSGSSVAAAGDVNGDGFDDLIVGATGVNLGSGASYVVFGGDFSGAVTFLGTSGADSLNGGAAAERFVSGQGNDTLTGGGGADVFNAGAGNDLIRVSNLAFAEIDGGSGTDTLVMLGAGQTLNLVARPNNEIAGIERINLTGGGDNTLKLSHHDLFDLSDTTNQIRVDGNLGDEVELVGSWTDQGPGATYHTYTLGAATILIDNDIFVI